MYEQYRKTLYVTGTPAKKYEKQQGILGCRSIERFASIADWRSTISGHGRPIAARQARTVWIGDLSIEHFMYILAFEHPAARGEAGVEALEARYVLCGRMRWTKWYRVSP
jgi:hypothetical protein